MIVYVEPTEAHLAEVRKRWVRALTPPERAVGQAPAVVPLGRARVSRWVFARAAAGLVDSIRATSTVLVAELAEVPGELVGFIAWHDHDGDRVLHMVYVLGPDQPRGARRLGIATGLLNQALDGAGSWSTSCTTKGGRALLDSYQARSEAA